MNKDIYTIYEVHYSHGMHDLNIEVPHYEFDRVIDNLSNEFEIYKKFEQWDSVNHPGFECLRTEYFITDYCGNPYKVGEIFERKLKS